MFVFESHPTRDSLSDPPADLKHGMRTLSALPEKGCIFQPFHSKEGGVGFARAAFRHTTSSTQAGRMRSKFQVTSEFCGVGVLLGSEPQPDSRDPLGAHRCAVQCPAWSCVWLN